MQKEKQNIQNNDALKGFLFRAYNACRCTNVGQALPDNKQNLIEHNSCVVGPEQQPLRTSALLTKLSGQALTYKEVSPSPLVGEDTRRAGEGVSRAFTLIELLVVVLIIGILAAVALPQYQQAVEKSKTMQLLVALKTLAEAEEVYYLENGRYTPYFTDLNVTYPRNSESLTVNEARLDLSQVYTMRVFGVTKHVEMSVFTKHGSGQAGTRHKPGMMICATKKGDKIGTNICKSLSGGTVVQETYICTLGNCTSYLIRA